MKKVLISAFLPFNNASNNYSMEVLNCFNSSSFDWEKKIIDVVYDEAYFELEKSNLNQYDLIVALGEARSRNEITIEQRAINLSSCSLPDNKGQTKQNEVIDINCNMYLETGLDLSQLKEKYTISNDAGKFVCNNLYFHLLKKYKNKSLFIHIPDCSNDKDKYIESANDINLIINILLQNK